MADRPWSDPANARRNPGADDWALGVADPDGTPGNFLYELTRLLFGDRTANLSAGFTSDFVTHPQASGALRPVIANGHWYEVTGSGDQTIDPPDAGSGPVSIFLPSTIVNVTLGAGFNLVLGTDNPSTERWLDIRRKPDGHVTASWATT